MPPFSQPHSLAGTTSRKLIFLKSLTYLTTNLCTFFFPPSFCSTEGQDVVHDIFIAGQGLSRLGESLSRYREKNGLYSNITSHDGVLVLSITATHAAWIQLLNISAECDQTSWDRRLEIARASMAIVREAIAADPACLHLLLGVSVYRPRFFFSFGY